MIITKKVVLLAAACIVILALFFYAAISKSGAYTINIEVVPADAKLFMGTTEIKQGKRELRPGKHTFTAKRPPFDDASKTIDTSTFPKGSTLYLIPEATSEEAKKMLRDDPELQAARESAGGNEAILQQQILGTKYPVLAVLPEANTHYKIDYGIKDEVLSIQVTLFAILNRPSQYEDYTKQLKEYKTEALEFLKKYGITPENTTISYTPDPDQQNKTSLIDTITDKLPFTSPNQQYRIEVGRSKKAADEKALYIYTISATGKEAALEWLSDYEINEANTEIILVNEPASTIKNNTEF